VKGVDVLENVYRMVFSYRRSAREAGPMVGDRVAMKGQVENQKGTQKSGTPSAQRTCSVSYFQNLRP